MKILLISCLILCNLPALSKPLYLAQLVRATPGKLLELIDAYQQQNTQIIAHKRAKPLIMRHTQGDHWDLMLLTPITSYRKYYEGYTARGTFKQRILPLIAWQEDLFVHGPSATVFAAATKDRGFFHIEMFLALPGKRAELLLERQMENNYSELVLRPSNLIFTRDQGAAWDIFTLGAYRDLQHFAEPAPVSQLQKQQAAINAGFAGVDKIGSYLRELINHHNDSLTIKVK